MKSVAITYIHYTKFHQQTSFICIINAYTHIHTKCLQFGAIFRHTMATWMFMDPCGPWHVYAPCGHFSLLFSIFFLSHFSPKRLYHPPYHRQSHDRLFPSPQHHVCLPPMEVVYNYYNIRCLLIRVTVL